MAIKQKYNFPKVVAGLNTSIKKANYIVARSTINNAKRITRVDTGALRDSYNFKDKPKGQKGRRLVFSNSQPYFRKIEVGLGDQVLINTINNDRVGIAKQYATQIKNDLKKVK